MSRSPIGRSPDLTRLRDEGYEVAVVAGHLVLRHVPYVTSEKKVGYGTLVSTLELVDDRTVNPVQQHVVSFIGEFPCHADGRPIEQLRNSDARRELAPDLVVDRAFSNKPPEGYSDYHAKMTSYVRIMANEAAVIDPRATAITHALVDMAEDDNVFEYYDTNESRGQFGAANAKLATQHIAIVGAGGTGSYVMDLVAKCPVRDIHIFDGDTFVQHNAFRSPGAAGRDEVAATPNKAERLKGIYSRMHRHIHAHPYYVGADNVSELNAMTFVFVCIDRPSAKPAIFRALEEAGIPFIDVGLGVEQVGSTLRGTVRTTLSTDDKRDHVARRVSTVDGDRDAYATNIQIADLNMLNATLAVIRWKKLLGFYGDVEREYHSEYAIEMNALVSEDE